MISHPDNDAATNAERLTLNRSVLLALIVLGLLGRYILSCNSIGSNDALTWFDLARLINRVGLEEAYRTTRLMNHPPLAAWAVSYLGSVTTSVSEFVQSFRLITISADIGVCVLLSAAGRSVGRPKLGLIAAAAFAVNPVAALVSGFHTNTDSLYAFFTLGAAYCVQTRRPFWAGLALGAALNVKLIPIVLVAPFLATCRRWQTAARMAGGLALWLLPYLPMSLALGLVLKRNMLDYNSNADRWGFMFLTGSEGQTEHFKPYFEAAASFYRSIGKYVVLGSSGVLAIAVFVRPNRWNAYQIALLSFIGFLVFTPGFGVQYLICVMPFLPLAAGRCQWPIVAFAGAFMLLQYVSALQPGPMLLSYSVVAPMPLPGPLFGLFAWALLVLVAVRLSRQATESTVTPV